MDDTMMLGITKVIPAVIVTWILYDIIRDWALSKFKK